MKDKHSPRSPNKKSESACVKESTDNLYMSKSTTQPTSGAEDNIPPPPTQNFERKTLEMNNSPKLVFESLRGLRPGIEIGGKLYCGRKLKKWKEIAKSDEGKFALMNVVDKGVEYSTKYRRKDPLTYDGKLKRNDRIKEDRTVEWDGRKLKERRELKVDVFVDKNDRLKNLENIENIEMLTIVEMLTPKMKNDPWLGNDCPTSRNNLVGRQEDLQIGSKEKLRKIEHLVKIFENSEDRRLRRENYKL